MLDIQPERPADPLLPRALPWTLLGALLALTLASSAASAAEPPEPTPATPVGPPPEKATTHDSDEPPDAEDDQGADEPPPVATPPVVVTGSRREVPADESPVRVRVIDEQEVRESGARDAAELVEEKSGLEVTRTFRGAGLQVQGLDARHVLVLVDGERLAGRVGEQVDLSRIPAEAIERIEILEGAASSLYGSDAIGGVINIITRKGRERLEGDVSVAYGSLNTADVTARVGLARKTWDLHVAGGYHHVDAYTLGPDPGTTGSELHEGDATVRARYRPSGAVTLDTRIQYLYRQQLGLDTQKLPPDIEGNPRYKWTDRRQQTHTLNALVGLVWRPMPEGELDVRLSTSLYDDRLDYDQRGSDKEDRSETTREAIGSLSVRYQHLIGDHILSGGLEGLVDALESARVEGGGAVRGRFAAYVQDEWTALDAPVQLVVVPGVRLDVDSQFGVAATPRLALRLDPADPLTIRASYGFGYRAPGFKELYLEFENPSVGYRVVGNPALAPEHSRSFHGGVTVRPLDELTLEATYFRHDVQDLIATLLFDDGGASGAALYSYANVDSVTSQGLEASVTARPVEGLVASVAYTFTDARDDATGLPLPGRAVHRGTASLRFRHDVGFVATFRVAVAGPTEQPDPSTDDPTSRVQSDPYALMDLRVAQELGTRHVTAFAVVDNVLDAGDVLFHPVKPRTFYAGLVARY